MENSDTIITEEKVFIDMENDNILKIEKKTKSKNIEYVKAYNKKYYLNNKDKHNLEGDKKLKRKAQRREYYLKNIDDFKIKGEIYRLQQILKLKQN